MPIVPISKLTVIQDTQLRAAMLILNSYANNVNQGKVPYSRRKFDNFERRINSRFRRYVKKRRRELKKLSARHEITEKALRGIFKFAETNLITAFEARVNRAFGQATHAIERALGKQLSAPGAFGIFGLLRILKRPRLEEETKVEGFTRLTKKGNIFSINLISYLILLISTAQEEWDRKASEAIAFETKVDLVRIDPWPAWLGPKADEVCNRWRDKIVSLSGLTAGFPKLSDALKEKPPLFHPNCRHSMHALKPREQRIAIGRGIKHYKTLRKYI